MRVVCEQPCVRGWGQNNHESASEKYPRSSATSIRNAMHISTKTFWLKQKQKKFIPAIHTPYYSIPSSSIY